MRLVLIFAGAAIAFCLLVFVSPMSFLGVTCFAIGLGGGGCIPSGVYYGAWFLAVGMIGFGLLLSIRHVAAKKTDLGSEDVNLHHPKWRALVDLDPEIMQVATDIRERYGPKYESMLAAKYLALNDKQYLKAAADNVAALAEKHKEDEAYNRRLPANGQVADTKFERIANNRYIIMSGRHYGKKFPSYEDLEQFVHKG